MSTKVNQIKVYTNGDWQDITKVYDGSGWKDFKGVYSDGTWYELLTCQGWELTPDCFSLSKEYQFSDHDAGFFGYNGDKIYRFNVFETKIYEYNLSTPWDISTISFNQSYDFGGSDGVTSGDFNDDGTILFITRWESTATVHKYSLSTPWDVSTITDENESANLEGDISESLVVSGDGHRMYNVDANDDTIYQYNLSTAFDLSSLSYSGNSINLSGLGNCFLKPDGTKLYLGYKDVDTYNLSSPFELDSATYDSTFSSYSANMFLDFKRDDGKILYVGDDQKKLYQYE